jgi:hypothetical protein
MSTTPIIPDPTDEVARQTFKQEVNTLTKGAPTKGSYTEPPSPADSVSPPQYPYNNIKQTESGHSFEMDDTVGNERIRLQHGKKPTFIEMHPTGDMVTKIVGDGYEIIAGNKNVTISGFCNITITGDCNMHVLGNMNQKVDGNYNLQVAGSYDVRSQKDATIQSDGDVSVSASPNFGGSLRLGASENLYLAGDLDVGGSITCDTITAESRVNAGLGVYAGPYGFTSSLGGLSLGYPTPVSPVATPGCITIVGSVLAYLPITSLVSVNAPLANFPVQATIGVMDAVLMTDSINTRIFDVHTHIGNLGHPTSPTNVPMV